MTRTEMSDVGPAAAGVTPARITAPIIEFVPWILLLPQTEYLMTHRLRYIETWQRSEHVLRPAVDVIELGSLSPISQFLREAFGKPVATVEVDLRHGYPVPDAAADVILVLEVLEHLNEAHRAGATIDEIAGFYCSGARNMFRECHRLLRPGGALVLTTPNATSLDTIGNILNRRHPNIYPPHVREYAPGDVVALAEEAGFRTERLETFFAWNSHPDVDRGALADGLGKLGFDMADRGDDAFFVFRKATSG